MRSLDKRSPWERPNIGDTVRLKDSDDVRRHIARLREQALTDEVFPFDFGVNYTVIERAATNNGQTLTLARILKPIRVSGKEFVPTEPILTSRPPAWLFEVVRRKT